MIYEVKFDPPLAELMGRLRSLEETLPDKGMRSALVASVKPLKVGIKGRVHDVTGSLRRSIGHKSLSISAKARLSYSREQVVLFVGATRKVAGSIGAPPGKKWDQNYKLHWLEKGVSAHDIPAVSKGGASFRGRKMLKIGNMLRRSVKHPGFAGRQLVWRSLQATRSQQQTLFYNGLAKFLDKYIP